jgi:TolC family type I secretion outer membrane protein
MGAKQIYILKFRWHLFFIFSLLFFFHARAEDKDLFELYLEALQNDPVLSSERYQNEAVKELINQGRSLFLPSISALANFDDRNQARKFLNTDSSLNTSSSLFTRGNKADYDAYGYSVVIRQPLFNYSAYSTYKQILAQTSLSDKKFHLVQQDLMMRISELYFDALLAKDKVELIQSQRLAIQEQLKEAETKFNAGLISITDINEAKTKNDLMEVDLLNAVKDLKIKKREIQSITGNLPGRLKPLMSSIAFEKMDNLAEEWIDIALQNSTAILIKEAEVEIAKKEIDVRKGEHYPTIDALASRRRAWDKGGYAFGLRNYSDTIGVEVNIPIFSGGLTSSKVREAQLLKDKTVQESEAIRRQVELQVREAYLNLQTNLSEIEAYQQALKSSELQLKSTEIGFREGLRNSVEVLNAQQMLFSAKYDLLASRYNYLRNLLNLKHTVGTLSIQDIEEINKYLVINQNNES